MKLRFTALTIALAAVSAITEASRAQGPAPRRSSPVVTTPSSQASSPSGAKRTLSGGDELEEASTWATPVSAGSRYPNVLSDAASPAQRSIGLHDFEDDTQYDVEDETQSMPAEDGIDDPMFFGDYAMDYDDACTARGGYCHVGGGLLGPCGGMGWLSDQFRFFGAWGGIEYTQAWAKGRSVPILATTGSLDSNIPGALGQPGTEELFGGMRIGNETQSGGRLTFGLWLDPCQTIGIGTRLFGLEGDSTGFHQESSDLASGLLAIPYYDFQVQAEDAILIARPGQLVGSLGIHTEQDVLTAEAFLRTLLLRGNGYRLDLIGGYHYTHIRDLLRISGNSVVPVDAVGSLLPDGSTIDLLDRFDTRNNFHGGELGLLSELRHGRWRLRSLAKISLGNMEQTVTVSGSTTVTVPEPNPAVAVDPNGLFAQQSNIGTFRRDTTTYIPEAALSLGYMVTPHLELSVGYSFIYWADVVLAGEQIDRVVDLTQAGGGPVGTRPELTFRETDFWVQGINFGLNWNY